MEAGSLHHMEPAPLGENHIRNIARADCLPALEKKKAGMEMKTKQDHEHNKKTPNKQANKKETPNKNPNDNNNSKLKFKQTNKKPPHIYLGCTCHQKDYVNIK